MPFTTESGGIVRKFARANFGAWYATRESKSRESPPSDTLTYHILPLYVILKLGQYMKRTINGRISD